MLIIEYLLFFQGSNRSQPSSSSRPAGGRPDLSDPAVLAEQFRNSRHDLALLEERNPAMAKAVRDGDMEKFAQEVQKIR